MQRIVHALIIEMLFWTSDFSEGPCINAFTTFAGPSQTVQTQSLSWALDDRRFRLTHFERYFFI